MSHDARIHFGDIGTDFVVEIPDESTDAAHGAVLDISAAITRTIAFEKPDGTTTVQGAAFTTDGTDGLIQFTTTTGFLDQVGRWGIQARVELPTGDWHTREGQFEVHPVIT